MFPDTTGDAVTIGAVRRSLGTLLVAGIVALTSSATTGSGARHIRVASCRLSPVSVRPPTPYMGRLSIHWLRQGKLWMGYTRADKSFIADPLGQKIGWYREAPGRLRISGTRLDSQAAPLQAYVPDGYGTTRFQILESHVLDSRLLGGSGSPGPEAHLHLLLRGLVGAAPSIAPVRKCSATKTERSATVYPFDRAQLDRPGFSGSRVERCGCGVVSSCACARRARRSVFAAAGLVGAYPRVPADASCRRCRPGRELQTAIG